MEEMDIEDLKKQRSLLKAKVTTSSNRLSKTVGRKLTHSFLSQLYTDLETNYTDFCIVDEQYKSEIDKDASLVDSYEVVNGLNLSKYTEAVENVYLEPRRFTMNIWSH